MWRSFLGPGDNRIDERLADAAAAGPGADVHGDEFDHAGSDTLISGTKAKKPPPRAIRRRQSASVNLTWSA
jgi:hypothetical protein